MLYTRIDFMRNIAININNSYLVFPPVAVPMLAHLGDAYIATKEYRRGEYKWVKAADAPEIVFVKDSDFEDAPEPMEKLRQEKEQATNNWMEYYKKNEELKKELKEAKEKLEKLQKAVQE